MIINIIWKIIVSSKISVISLIIIITIYKVSIDTYNNHIVMQAEEQRYRKIIHLKKTKSIAFENRIIHLPNVSRDCMILIEELRMFETDIDRTQNINMYRRNLEDRGYYIYFLNESNNDETELDQLKRWNVNHNKNTMNLYTVSRLYPVVGEVDLRCLF